MIASRRLGILGGTFDPIHFGHLDAADAARRALQLDRGAADSLVRSAASAGRSAGVRRSIGSRSSRWRFKATTRSRASDMELTRTGPSYTADTLRAVARQGWRPSQIFFILGSDAFAEIATWREFPAVLDAANFVVIARPGTTLDAAAARTPTSVRLRRRTERPAPAHLFFSWRRARATCHRAPSAPGSLRGNRSTISFPPRSRGTSSRIICTER